MKGGCNRFRKRPGRDAAGIGVSGMLPHNRHRGGFTLIELLVVIAIIAILAAILFPVFVKARDQAKLGSCISNMKQLAVATQQYQGDYEDCFPWAVFYNNATHTPDNVGGWPVGQYVGGDSGLESKIDPRVPVAKERPLFKYTKNMGMWQCPSEPKFTRTGTTEKKTDFEWWGNSYPMNAAWMVDGSVVATLAGRNVVAPQGGLSIQWGRKAGSIKRLTRVMMYGDRAMHAYFASPNTIEGAYPGESEQQARLHRFRNHDKDAPKSPVVFCDGHTGYIRMTPAHNVTVNGVSVSTYGLWDENAGWALMERGWIPGKPMIGAPTN